MPARVSFTQRGAVAWVPALPTLVLPAASRRWKLTPLAGEEATSINPCAEDPETDVRIMTPALVQVLTAWMLATRATMVPSPVRGRYA